MELLSWMKKVDMTMDKLDLLDLIDHMHELISAIVLENEKKDLAIRQLRQELKKEGL